MSPLGHSSPGPEGRWALGLWGTRNKGLRGEFLEEIYPELGPGEVCAGEKGEEEKVFPAGGTSRTLSQEWETPSQRLSHLMWTRAYRERWGTNGGLGWRVDTMQRITLGEKTEAAFRAALRHREVLRVTLVF